MIAFKEWLINTLTADSQLQTLLNATSSTMPIFPVDADISPEQFPCITYMDAGTAIRTVPKGVRVGRIQLDVWSTSNALEVENIYERLGALLNFANAVSTSTPAMSGILWWMREESARDLHTPKRRLWRKSVDYKWWGSNTTLT